MLYGHKISKLYGSIVTHTHREKIWKGVYLWRVWPAYTRYTLYVHATKMLQNKWGKFFQTLGIEMHDIVCSIIILQSQGYGRTHQLSDGYQIFLCLLLQLLHLYYNNGYTYTLIVYSASKMRRTIVAFS